MPTTTRLGIPYPSGSDPISEGDDNFQDIAELLDDIAVSYIKDVIANRPAAAQEGLLFISTDEGRVYADTGSAWIKLWEAPDGGIVTAKLADDAVTPAKLADSAVETAALDDEAVTGAKINPALKPSGSAAPGDEALRALGYTAGKAMPGDGAAAVPLGAMVPYGGSSAPAGWLLCDGGAVARVGTYADLFAAIGTAYGPGDGSSTFNVPDLRGRSPVGKGAHADVDTLGESDGGANSTRSPKHAHTVVNAGTHSHGGGTGGRNAAHIHLIGYKSAYYPSGVGSGIAYNFYTPGPGVGYSGGLIQTESADHAHAIGADGDHTHVVGSTGRLTDSAGFQVVNYIIRAT